MTEEVKQEPVPQTKFEQFCLLITDSKFECLRKLVFWADVTKTPQESKHDPRTLAKAVEQRERRKLRNLRNVDKQKHCAS